MTTLKIVDIHANPPFISFTLDKELQMTTLLKYLGKVSTGVTIREAIDSSVDGNTRLLQIKDLPRIGSQFGAENLPTINWDLSTTPQYLTHNSVVIIGRGEPKAYLFTGEQRDRVMISSALINVELNNELVIPEFLVWYINNATSSSQHFHINSRDMTLQMTSISTVKNLPITLPSLEQQKEILRLEHCATQENIIFKRMSKLRKELNKAASEEILQQSINNTI